MLDVHVYTVIFLQDCEAFDQIFGYLLNTGLLSQARELADIFNHNSVDLTIVLVSMKACCYNICKYCIPQNFCWLKFLPTACTLYWDKTFNFTNRASYLPRSSGWSSRVCRYVCYAHMRVRSQSRTQNSMCHNFHCAKKFAEKIFTNIMHWRNWRKFSPGKNFYVYSLNNYCMITQDYP